MKRFISAILAIAALFCMGSCAKDAGDGSINSSSDTLKQEDNISNQPSRDASSTSQEPLKDGMDLQKPKQLVVYFSRTGNTQAVAQEIVSQTGADSFEILPKEPYVEDYDELLDIARDEQNSGARPELLNQAENLQQYDTIYIGYPIWYGDMPMILYSFLENCDLSGKTIAPFCTSGGSGLSGTPDKIQGVQPQANVTEGLQISGASAGNCGEQVSNWLNKIGALQ